MRIINTTAAMALASSLALVGCGGETATEAMTGRVQNLGSELTELRELAEGHHGRVTTSNDVAVMSTEEEAYEHEALEHHSGLMHAVEELSPCMHEGHGPHTETLANGLQELKAELSRHNGAMKASIDVGVLSAEEAQHKTAMAAIFTGLSDEATELAGEASTYACPMADDHSDAPQHGAGHE